MQISKPQYYLGVIGISHGAMNGQMSGANSLKIAEVSGQLIDKPYLANINLCGNCSAAKSIINYLIAN